MLSDQQWALLEPLIEAIRPKGKTRPQDLRRTIAAILWRLENGAKWRADTLSIRLRRTIAYRPVAARARSLSAGAPRVSTCASRAPQGCRKSPPTRFGNS